MKNDIERAVERIRSGGMVILVDDADRENEGDLVIACEFVTAEAVNIAVTHGRGLVCCALTPELAGAFALGPQVHDNSALHGTNFTVSVDAATGVSTGISVGDRATVLRLLGDPQTPPEAFARPGHVFPIVAHPHGLAERRGHTEAAVALIELAGLTPSAMICEILDDNGNAANAGDLRRLAVRLDLPLISIDELAKHLRTMEVAG